MSPVLLLIAVLLAAAPSARAATGRAVEPVTFETPGLKSAASPTAGLQLNPAGGLLAPNLAPSLAPTALTPGLIAPSIVAPNPELTPMAPYQTKALVPATPEKPVDALRRTGAALTNAKPGTNEGGKALDALFAGEETQRTAASTVELGPSGARGPALAPASPAKSSGRKMPAGVKKAFQNSAVLGGGMAALSAALWAWSQSLPSAPPAALFAVLAFPLLLIPAHFSFVSGFWASRFYLYPKMSDAGKSAFRKAWLAFAVTYPLAALAALTIWAQSMGRHPALLAVFGLPLLVALGEVTHHFLYRLVPERAQDKGKPLTDWRSRLGGNIGQQLARMKR